MAALLDEESDTALLVVGSRGTAGFPDIVVGEAAVAVAEHARSEMFRLLRTLGSADVGVEGIRADHNPQDLLWNRTSAAS